MSTTPSTWLPLWAFLLLLLGAMAAAFWLVFRTVDRGRWKTKFLVFWAVSPGSIIVVATVMEHRLGELFHHLQWWPWIVVFGDGLVLPTAGAVLAHAWQYLPDSGWHHQWQWKAAAITYGLAAALFFRYNGSDTAFYRQWGRLHSRLAPTKLAHDVLAFWVLAGALCWLLVPVIVYLIKAMLTGDRALLSACWPAAVIAIVCLAVWAGLGVHDGLHPRDPNHLHPDWWRWPTDAMSNQVARILMWGW